MRRRVGIQASQAVTFSCRLPELSCPHILLEYWLHNLPALILKKNFKHFYKRRGQFQTDIKLVAKAINNTVKRSLPKTDCQLGK
jgi:hypothetical protein